DPTFAVIAHEPSLTELVEQRGDHFSSRRDDLGQILLLDVVADGEPIGRALAQLIGQFEQRANQPLLGKVERHALETLVGFREAVTNNGQEIEQGLCIGAQPPDQLVERDLHHLARFQRDGLLVALARTEAQFAEDLARLVEPQNQLVSALREHARLDQAGPDEEHAARRVPHEVAGVANREAAGRTLRELFAQLAAEKRREHGTARMIRKTSHGSPVRRSHSRVSAPRRRWDASMVRHTYRKWIVRHPGLAPGVSRGFCDNMERHSSGSSGTPRRLPAPAGSAPTSCIGHSAGPHPSTWPRSHRGSTGGAATALVAAWCDTRGSSAGSRVRDPYRPPPVHAASPPRSRPRSRR